MALTATLYRFEIALADADRGVYETLELRVARHPSESGSFLLVRVLAYCLEYQEGIAFSKGGISDVSEPAISVLDLTGRRLAWIEVGAPSADRLHRASKSTERVAVYTDRRIELLRASLAGQRIHRGDEIAIVVFPSEFLRALESKLARIVRWDVSINDGHLFVTADGQAYDAEIERQRLD